MKRKGGEVEENARDRGGLGAKELRLGLGSRPGSGSSEAEGLRGWGLLGFLNRKPFDHIKPLSSEGLGWADDQRGLICLSKAGEGRGLGEGGGGGRRSQEGGAGRLLGG